MREISLRSLISAVSIFVAVAIAVSVPLAHFVVVYSIKNNVVAEHAAESAGSLAKYIYSHNTLWQYQSARLFELLETQFGHADQRQRVFDSRDKLVVEVGPSQTTPTLLRSAPVVVAGAVVGRVDMDTSLRPLLIDTGLIAVLSILLGLVTYSAVRVFPLRVLDRTLGALEAAKCEIQVANEHLREQNRQFDAALSNMSQGLCMFDSSERLIVANRRFSEMFGIPPGVAVRGLTVPELMRLSESHSQVAEKDRDLVLEQQRKLVELGVSGTIVVNRTDGRTISVSQQARADGGFVATFDDVTERRRAEEKINYMAHFDALTGLPNRVSFYEQIENTLPHVDRGETFAVFSIDLDHFKNVNDTLGHPIGDRLLQAAAERMRGCIRERDIVGRLGGDEFAIVQTASEQPSDATALARRLIDTVGAVYDLGDHQVVIGASIGITFAPGDGSEADQLVKNADLAMYRAKADGGGTYRFFEAEMDARMQARRVLELDLRKAVVNHEFTLVFQPLVNLKTGRITSFEALVRWQHPTRGEIQPNDFISVAEETALIVPIGEWVLRQACIEAVHWPDDITLAVNLSPVQFNSEILVRTVVAALSDSGLPANRLELEITELVLLQDNAATFRTLHEIRDLGVKIAMDDFGTGYSSLGYLRKFPFDKIKIDQSFIHDVDTKDESLAIVRAVVGLGSSLGITTTAEGVETSAQLERLRNEGCTEMQGFLFSPPRPASEIQTLLAGRAPRPQAVA